MAPLIETNPLDPEGIDLVESASERLERSIAVLGSTAAEVPAPVRGGVLRTIHDLQRVLTDLGHLTRVRPPGPAWE